MKRESRVSYSLKQQVLGARHAHPSARSALLTLVSSFGGWKIRTSAEAPLALLGSTASATEKASKMRP